MRCQFAWVVLLGWTMTVNAARADEVLSGWKRRLTFHASFDQSPDADFAAGDRRIYTAASLDRKTHQPGLGTDAVTLSDNGRFGACLQFHDTTSSVVYFAGQANVPYQNTSYGMTIAFWMRLSPDEDLKPGYVDPLQITDKQWNNASVFVDFTKDERPRHFRLGVFADYAFWNPQDTPWEQIAEADRPLVTVKHPPFRRDRWTHVALSFDQLNAGDAEATASLYLDGQLQGSLVRPQRFSWQPENVAIMLGIQYIGWIDDFAIFSDPMTTTEVRQLMDLPRGIESLP